MNDVDGNSSVYTIFSSDLLVCHHIKDQKVIYGSNSLAMYIQFNFYSSDWPVWHHWFSPCLTFPRLHEGLSREGEMEDCSVFQEVSMVYCSPFLSSSHQGYQLFAWYHSFSVLQGTLVCIWESRVRRLFWIRISFLQYLLYYRAHSFIFGRYI